MTLRLSSRIGIAALMLFAPLAAAPAQASLAPNSGILPVSAIPAQSQEPDPLTPSGPGVAICFAETTGDNTHIKRKIDDILKKLAEPPKP